MDREQNRIYTCIIIVAMLCPVLFYIFAGFDYGIWDEQCTPFCGVDMFSHMYRYTCSNCLQALCLHLPVSVVSSFSALAAVYLLCARVVCFRFKWSFSLLLCNSVCVCWAPRGRHNIYPLGTPVDTPTPHFQFRGGASINGGNTQRTWHESRQIN